MVWEIVWSIVLGVILGGIVTGGTMFSVEWWKSNVNRKNWASSLLAEANGNRFKKTLELIIFYREIAGCMDVKEVDFLKHFDNTFEVFKSFLSRGIHLKNKDLIYLYSNYELRENSINMFLKKTASRYFKLPEINRKNSIFRPQLIKQIKQIETQLYSIDEIYNLLEIESDINLDEKGLKLDITSLSLLMIQK